MKAAREVGLRHLKARAWFHGAVCSGSIGAGDPSEDARGARRRGDDRGETAEGNQSESRLRGSRDTGQAPFVPSDERSSERGTLRYDEAFFCSVTVL